jgi:hypothetical protein
MSSKPYVLIIGPEAEQELSVSKDFYEQKQEFLGDDFIREVDSILDRIAVTPEHFPKIRKKQVRKANLKRFPFGIYYAVDGLVINVLAVFHFSRNPKQVNKRF